MTPLAKPPGQLLTQPPGQGPKMVWLSTPIGEDCVFARLIGQKVQQVCHPLPQGAAWCRDVAFISVFSPGHDVPSDFFATVLGGRWECGQKPWGDSHG